MRELIAKVDHAFQVELASQPLMSLRSGNAVDGYNAPIPYDPAMDKPSAEYFEANHWGLAHLDAGSWRHYLAWLLSYAVRHVDNPRSMAVDSFLASLRPPDRSPPRFAALNAEQEAAVAAVLDLLAFDERSKWQEAAIIALEEYWAPGASYRKPSSS